MCSHWLILQVKAYITSVVYYLLSINWNTFNSSYIFSVDNKKGDKAFLQYDYITNNKVDLYHTLVPPSYRGHGIAGILAEV